MPEPSSVHAVKDKPPMMTPGLKAMADALESLLDVVESLKRHGEPPKRPLLKLIERGRDDAR